METLLVRELVADQNVKVSFIFSNLHTTLEGLETVPLTNAKRLNDVDAVVVAEPYQVKKIKRLQGDISETPILVFKTILEDIYTHVTGELELIDSLVALKNKGYAVLMVSPPIATLVKQPSTFEQYLRDNKLSKGLWSKKDPKEVFPLSGLDKRYTLDEYVRIMKTQSSSIQRKNYWVQSNVTSQKFNVVENNRLTTDVPDTYHSSIHIVGDSTMFAAGTEDRYTTASQLQRMINGSPFKGIRVINESMVAAVPRIIANRLKDSSFASRDTIVAVRRNGGLSSMFSELAAKNDIPFIDAQPYFQRPHNMGEVFLNNNHINCFGSERVAELIFEHLFDDSDKSFIDTDTNKESNSSDTGTFNPYLTPSDAITSKILPLEEYFDPIVQSPEFAKYIDKLRSLNKQPSSSVGSIVMNCNPFTKGHRFLIETCAAKVDLLYIFVVEEDRSDFPFEDRIKLVRSGTADLGNVEVLPSGNFIISTLTFPEYFEKGDIQEATIDPSNDVELYGKHIAPALNINKRFVGEEPLDRITLQYNETMKKILPGFGIEVEVIPRIEHEGAPISASRVRRLLADKDFESIAEIVPETTYSYLVEKYSGNNSK
jgi:[citrate (pro-3S)-lyase] ligase